LLDLWAAQVTDCKRTVWNRSDFTIDWAGAAQSVRSPNEKCQIAGENDLIQWSDARHRRTHDDKSIGLV
jgi:hypothetical protein